MKKVIQIANLDCAACAAELQEELEGIEGVKEASVDFVGQRVSLDYDTEEAFKQSIYTISHFEEVEIVDGNAPRKKESRLKEILSIAIAAALFLPALILELVGGVSKWVSFGLYMGAFVAAGWMVVFAVARNLKATFDKGFHPSRLLDENLLMLIAAVGAFVLGQNMEGAIVMLLYEIGELLQSIAVGSSRGAIEKLMALKSDTAILVDEDGQREVAAEQLTEGDVILLRKGDKLPADCVLLEGETALDTKTITGEAYLREVRAGEEMLAGCVNEGAVVKAKVVRPSSESAVAKILSLVENSTAKKAKPEKFITRFARIYTPVVVLIALFVAVLPPLIINYASGAEWSLWVGRALNFLVISCPCALIISVPLTYISGVGSLARAGVLCKGAVYLDSLAKVKVAAFDKTGTLTEGKFSVARVHGERAFRLAVAVERGSSHPLAQAFAGEESDLVCTNVKEISGMGLSAEVDGKPVLVGSERLLREQGIGFSPVTSPCSVIYVAEGGEYLGCVEIEDRVKADAKDALTALKRAGVARIAVLTGDTQERAAAALEGLPVDEVCAGLLPEEKPACARGLKAQGMLLYAGDGVNDTPVMAESDVAVSMGSLGSDAAIEASDLVLASDSLSALPRAMRGAKKTKKIVLENIAFSIGVKVVLMVLSVLGFIPLWAAVLGDVGVMLLAVLNSMRMRAKLK